MKKKNGNISIDAVDAAIIDLLQKDGRMTASEIAEQIQQGTPRMVRYRIDKLVKAGVISITAVVHPKPLGYTVMADILVGILPGKIPEIAQALSELENVSYVGYTTGDRDISIQVVTKSVEELQEIILRKIQKMPGVTRTQTYLLPNALKFTYNWKPPREVYAPDHGKKPLTE